MKRLLLAGLVLTAWIVPLLGTTRYVSRSGSNTPPYDTWEKAIDSLGLAFKIANPYDTVRVAAGTFYSDSNEIIFQIGMVLIGAGRDSTHIIRSPVMSAAYFFLIKSFCQVKSVHMNGLGQTSVAVLPLDSARWSSIESNRIEGFYTEAIAFGGAFFDRSLIRIVNNIIENCDQGIDFSVTSGLIQGNIFRNILGTAIYAIFQSPYLTIANNTFGPNVGAAISEGVFDSCRVVNNTFIEIPNHGVSIGGGDFERPEISNNHFYKVDRAVVPSQDLGRAANNTLIDNQVDFELGPNDSIEKIHHNVIWRTNGFQPAVLPNNYSFDPMFVDSVEWKLQFASPAIDTGDTDIFDLDGTRSDLGIWGGPWGKITLYPDLAPRTPLNFSGLVQSDTTVTLSWRSNTEADLKNYLLFRGFSPGVPTDSAHLWATIANTDTSFSDGKLTESRFYKLVAIDTTGNASVPTSEITLTPTGVEGEPGALPRQFELHQNYPNPFNAATVVSFVIPSGGGGNGELAIYSLRGEKVRVLVQGFLKAGKHTYTWDGRNERGLALPSGVYFYSLKISEQRLNKKMTLVK